MKRKLYSFIFSGTGNTKYVVTYLSDKLSQTFDVEVFDISHNRDYGANIKQADLILIGFPIYGSSPPIPVKEFIHKYADLFKNKQVAIAETQYFFSGDGSASLGRTLEKKGAKVLYAEHFDMPNNLADSSIFKIKNGKELQKTLDKAKKKMDDFADKIISEKPFRRGFNPVSHAIGYFCQRKWWRDKEYSKRSAIKADFNKCKACGLCVKNCPVDNLMISDGYVHGKGQCVLCYRCVNLCPVNALTLIGKEVKTPYKGISDK